MGNGNDSMAFGDFAKVLGNFARNIFDTIEVNTVPDANQITFVNRQYNTELLLLHDTFQGFYLQFFTGELAGQTFEIQDTFTNGVFIEPAMSTLPQPGDEAVITNIRNFIDPEGFNLEEWGGTELTGADITQNLLNLDMALTTLLGGIRGPGGFSFTEVVTALRSSPNENIADNVDISGGANFFIPLGEENRWRNTSLYIRTAGAIDITLELSPENSGSPDFFEPAESPLVFTDAGENIFEIDFTWKGIQLTGSNTNLVTAKLKGLV